MTAHFPKLPRPRGEQAWSRRPTRPVDPRTDTVELPALTPALAPAPAPSAEPSRPRRGRRGLLVGAVLLAAAASVSTGLAVAAGAGDGGSAVRSDSTGQTVVQGPQVTSTAPTPSTPAPTTTRAAPQPPAGGPPGGRPGPAARPGRG